MTEPLDPSVTQALRLALRTLPSRQVRAITLEVTESFSPAAYHLIAFHHGPVPGGLRQKLQALCDPVLAETQSLVSAARVTLKRHDRPKPIESAGFPLFVQPGTVVAAPEPPPPTDGGKVGPSERSLDALEPLSPAMLARHRLAPEAARARRQPLTRLKPEALLALLHDGRGFKHVLPHALKAARLDPWADRGHHPGDLLMAVLQAPVGTRPVGTALHHGIVVLATTALKAAAKLSPARRLPDLETDIARLLRRWQDGDAA